jgi:hypothetical protein
VAFPGPGTVINSGTSGAAVLDFILVTGPAGAIGDLTAASPLRYIGSEFALNVGSGLETVGTTLAANFADASAQNLGAAAAGTSVELSRGDHVHAMPSAANVGAIGTASLSTSSALALGTAAAGTAVTVARGDHVHPTDGVVLNALFTASGQLLSSSGAGTPVVISIEDDQLILSAQVFG